MHMHPATPINRESSAFAGSHKCTSSHLITVNSTQGWPWSCSSGDMVRACLQTYRCLHFHNSRTYLRVPWALALWACPEKMPRHKLGKFHRGLCPVGGTMEEDCEESFLWGGRSGRDSMCWTDHTTHSMSPCATEGKEVKKLGMKLCLGRREEWGEGVLPLLLL